MNKAYRLVWSATRQVWIVASEKAASGGRPPLAVKRAAAFLLLGVTGSALATDYSGSTVSAGQVQNVNSGDTAHGVTVSGLQSVNSGAFTQFTLVNSGGQQHINDGAQDGLSTVNSGGIQSVNPRGEASSTTVNSGGEQRVYEDASAIGVTLNGGRQLVRGSVDQTTVNSGGVQSIDGGTALNTRVNTGGVQNVNSGGSDRFTILLGVQNVNSGGSVDKTKVLSGGVQSINGGTALNTEVRVGGVQNVNSGGSASEAAVYGVQNVNSGGSASEAAVYGVQNVNSGGSASKAAVHGVQNVNSGGMVFDTTVNTGGLLTVESGGILGGTTTLTDGAMLTEKSGQQYASVINQGILKFNQHNNSTWAGRLTGSGQLTKDGKGTLTLGGTLNQSHVNLDGGSLVMDGLQAVTDIIAKADTTLSLVNGASLTGSIDPTDVSIDDRSNWNITGDSQVNNLTNDGRIVFATQSGTFTPHTLTVSNFTGSGGTLTLNTVAGDSSSPTDKVVIDGGRASGNTGLQVLNRGGLGAQTAGSGIPVIQTINGATTDAGAFSMSNPLVAGAYEYSLYRNADESWYLTTQKTSGGDTSGGNTSGGNTSGGNTSGGNTSGGNTSGGNTSGGSTSGGNTSGGNTSGGNTSGGNTSGGDTSGGSTSGGSTSGGSTSGGNTSGGNTSGGNTSGGNTSGGSAVPSGEVNYRAAMWSYVAMPSLSMDYDRLVAGTADTRFHYAPDSRIWGRLAAGKLSHRSRGSLNGTSVPESSSAYSFFQLGGDLWQLDGANADWRAGIYGATGVMRSDIWRDGGTASAGTDRDTVYTGGAYLSGRTHSGLHIDGLLQASRHSLKAASQDGTRLSTHGTGWLVSAEVGQAFTLTPSLALDPQLQYTMQGLSLGDAQDEAASLSWSDSRRQSVRAGLKLGTPQGEKAKLAWWLTPSVTQSYGGHSGFTASVPGVTGSEASFRSNMSGTSVGLNGGVSASIRKNVKLGVQAGWSESLHGSEAGGYSGMLNLGVSFR